MNNYLVTIGLEIHVELSTKTKLFCGCANRFAAPPNSLTCPVCLGLPGTLPVLNRLAVEYGIRAALALGCSVAPVSVFARKNYFYPDLPKGYQVSQLDQPLATDGRLIVATGAGQCPVRINRVHLEEDAGKSLHGEDACRAGADRGHSLLDFNRCGVPLIEIVTEPDLTSPADARVFLESLKQVLEYTGVSDVRMEEGSLRCDANVSLRPADSDELGVPTEIKNLNSFRFVQRALEHEIERQATLLRQGQPVRRETRQYVEATAKTETLRGKEEAHDYRYFPDPDLLRLQIAPEWVEQIRGSLPELPWGKQDRYLHQHKLAQQQASVLTASLPLASFYDKTVELGADPREAANWIIGELTHLLNTHAVAPGELKLPPQHLVELLQLIDNGTLSRPMAKQVFEQTFTSGRAPAAVVQEAGMSRISDEEELGRLAEQVIVANPGPAADYRQGKKKALGFLVGKIMQQTQGQADPKAVNRILQQQLAQQ